MHNAVLSMLEKYSCKTASDYKNALKEIVQEITLLGLYRNDFFKKAAFYGGSALRIFYGLERFSEDLDFSLTQPDTVFNFENYFKAIEEELAAFGFKMTVEKKIKSARSNIDSAFIKGGTKFHIMNISPDIPGLSALHKNENLKIKLEIDINPPPGAEFEVKYQLIPIPYHVKLYDNRSLFAGKIHALLCRNWSGRRIKGRDLYDYIWYLSKSAGVNLYHLEQRMKQTGHLEKDFTLTAEKLRSKLFDKFELIDFENAKKDILPFVKDTSEVEIWSKDFFRSVTADADFI